MVSDTILGLSTGCRISGGKFCNEEPKVEITEPSCDGAQVADGGDSQMQQRKLTIVNRLGLHARAAVKLVSLCSKYVSEVIIVANGRRANARHMMAILLL